MITDDLIAAVEAATEGNAPLGAKVLAATRGGTLLSFEQYGAELWIACEFPNGERCELRHLANPTTLLDAAVPLVPDGWQWQVSNRAPAPHKGRAYLRRNVRAT